MIAKHGWKVLLIDDDEDDSFIIRSALSSINDREVNLEWIPNSLEAQQALQRQAYDVILVDYHLAGENGLQMIQTSSQSGINVPMILLSGLGSYELDLEAMQAGALFYLDKKELTPRVLERTIRYAIERKQIEQALKQKEIEYASLYEKEARHVRQLEALHTATNTLLETLDFQKLTEKVLKAVLNAFPAARQSMLFIPDPDMVDCCTQGVAQKRESAIQRKFTLQRDNPIAVYTRKAVLEEQSLKVDAFQQSSSAAIEANQGSLLIVPLKIGSDFLGAITLVSPRPNSFEENDLTFLESFAATTTAALHNARLHERIQQIAITDSLTHLLNRRGFFNYAEREFLRFLRTRKSLSLILLDIDHFKQINDTYGHAFGDQVLQELASICTKSIRKVDLLGRYGGDEFIILLPDTDSLHAVRIAERVRESFDSTPFKLKDESIVSFSASFGVTQAIDNTSSLNELIPQADAALYVSKKQGRNQVTVFG
ncbi:MAG TPA: diguanylate cyclase [Anaerolineaceae bacterium]|nr:diguanylate cyclase [Anaerolineaceae bacterium]